MLSPVFWQRFLLAASLVLGLFLRLNASIQDFPPLKKDAAEYDRLAIRLSEAKGYTNDAGALTARRPPLYPAFLAGVYGLFGHDLRTALLTQAVLGTLTVGLIMRWAFLLFGMPAACWAGLLAAVYPPFYAHTSGCQALVSETLFTFLLTAFFCTLFEFLQGGRSPWAWVSGLALGLAILTKPVPMLLPLVLPLLLRAGGFAWRQVLRYSVPAATAVFLVLLPWTLRNYSVFRAIVPVSTHGGMDFYLGNHPGADGIGGTDSGREPYYRDVMVRQSEALDAKGWNEAQKSKFFFAQALDFLRHHPQEGLRLFVRRIGLFNDARTTLEEASGPRRILNAGYLIAMLGAMAAYMLARKDAGAKRALTVLALLYGYFVFMHALIAATDRYRLPVEPLLIVASSYGMAWLAQRTPKKKDAS